MAQVRDFKGTSDGEWDVSGGDFATVADGDAVPQGIRVRLGLFQGEAYLDEDAGVNYFDRILIKNPDPLVVRAELARAIADTPDVTSVVGAQLIDEGDRQASISYTADTIYAESTVSGTVVVP